MGGTLDEQLTGVLDEELGGGTLDEELLELDEGMFDLPEDVGRC